MTELLYTPISTHKQSVKKNKKTKKTATGQDPTPVSIAGKVYETVIVTWGRMNPPTKGHELVVNKIKKLAEDLNAEAKVYISHSNDSKSNPLLFEDKLRFAKIAFGDIVQNSPNIKTLVEMLQEVNKTYKTLHMVVGSDRVDSMKTRINEMNGKHFHFDNITIHSAGDRNILSEEVDGISGTKIRQYIKENNYDKFLNSLPNNLLLYSEEIFRLTKIGMNLVEELEKENLLAEELSQQERLKKAITLRRFEGKIQRARELTLSRRATTKRLVSRARHHAIMVLREKLAGQNGANYTNLPAVLKNQVDKRIAAAGPAVKRLALKMLPQLKKLDTYRASGMSTQQNIKEEEIKDAIKVLVDTL